MRVPRWGRLPVFMAVGAVLTAGSGHARMAILWLAVGVAWLAIVPVHQPPGSPSQPLRDRNQP